MAAHAARAEPSAPIDPDTLERMARIARGLPGRTVTVTRADRPPGAPESGTVLRIDGVSAADIVERCEHDE